MLTVVPSPEPEASTLRDACAALATDLSALIADLRGGLEGLRRSLDAIDQPDPMAVVRGWDHAARILNAEQRRQAQLLGDLREATRRNRDEADRLLAALAETEREIDQLAFRLRPPVEDAAARLFAQSSANGYDPAGD
jgi:ABC-type transporter Mla subunit MlaD